MPGVVDIFMIYQFLRRIVKPFTKWEAYRLGIIDANGKVLKKRKTLKTSQERKAWGYFEILTANLKKILAKIPGGATRIATFAAALALLKEENRKILENEELTFSDESVILEELHGAMEIAELHEEAIANVGANHAGLGQGPDGEPGVRRTPMSRYKKRNEKNAPKVVFANVRRVRTTR